MGRFADWLWRRHRSHYLVALAVVVELVMVVGFIPIGVGALSVLVGMGWADGLLLAALASPLAALGPLVTISRSTARHQAISAWAQGDFADPASAWVGAVHAPPAWSSRATVVNFGCAGLFVLGFTARRAELTSVELVALGVIVAVFFVASGLVLGVGFQMLFRPMLDEVTPHLPATGVASTPARWSLRGRFFVGIASTCFLSGVLAAGAVTLTHTRESAMVVLVAVSGLGAGYMLLFFGALLVLPTFRPLRDLTAATARVRLGDFEQPVPVTTADEFGELGAAFNEMQRGLREREALRAAFGSYVDPMLAQRLIESGSPLFDGEELEVTVLFADVRDFTSYSERVRPAEAVSLLNRLFDVMVPVLHSHGGHANHYLGDGLLAVFGAPQPLVAHADAAVAAAVEIQALVRAALGDELRIGIGINTGLVIAGTVGGGGRLEFTVIGDTVNVAARVEAMTKQTGDAILITEATRRSLSAPRPRSVRRGECAIRGKGTKVALHAVEPVPLQR